MSVVSGSRAASRLAAQHLHSGLDPTSSRPSLPAMAFSMNPFGQQVGGPAMQGQAMQGHGIQGLMQSAQGMPSQAMQGHGTHGPMQGFQGMPSQGMQGHGVHGSMQGAQGMPSQGMQGHGMQGPTQGAQGMQSQGMQVHMQGIPGPSMHGTQGFLPGQVGWQGMGQMHGHMMGQAMGNQSSVLLTTVMPQSRPAQHKSRQGPGGHGHPKAKPATISGSCTCFGQMDIKHKLHILAMAHPVEWNPVNQATKTVQDMEAAFIVGFDRFPGSGLEERRVVTLEDAFHNGHLVALNPSCA